MSVGDLPPSPIAGEAARMLLRAKSGYGFGDKNVTPFVKNRVSLPARDELWDAPMALDVLPGEARHYLEGFEHEMLRETTDYLELLEHGPDIVPYMDPILSNDPSAYADFVRELYCRSLVQWTLEPKEFCALLFVKRRMTSSA